MIHASKSPKAAWSVARLTADSRAVLHTSWPTAGELVWCVQVFTGAIITRRNGKVAVVGNCQIVGRGTRPIGDIVPALNRAANAWERVELIRASSKPHVKLLDFLWQYEKHDLCAPASLLTADDRVKEMVAGTDGDIIAATEKAERDLLKKLEEDLKRHSRKKSTVVDPLAIAASLGDTTLANYEPMTATDRLPMTDGQRKVLEGNGVNLETVHGRGHANVLVNRILARHAKGLATIRQLNFFRKIGIDASEWSKEEASVRQGQQIAAWTRQRAAKKAAGLDIQRTPDLDLGELFLTELAFAPTQVEDLSEIFGAISLFEAGVNRV